MSQITSAKWTCAVCGVSASRSDVESTPLPEFWETGTDGTFCLGCRRHRAAEAAAEAAPDMADRNDRAKLRRTAIIEFEVRRAPERTNGSIAKCSRSSIPAVVAARRRLEGVGS